MGARSNRELELFDDKFHENPSFLSQIFDFIFLTDPSLDSKDLEILCRAELAEPAFNLLPVLGNDIHRHVEVQVLD